MKHLTTDEIIEYVSFDIVNESNLMLASRVNGHIRGCASCFKRVKAYQTIYDRLEDGAKGKELELLTEEFLKDAFCHKEEGADLMLEKEIGPKLER